MAEKQKKVVNSIKRTNKKSDDPSANLHKKNNDECYTDMQDITNELSYWTKLGKLTGKKIICPCDWDGVMEDAEGRKPYKVEIDFIENERYDKEDKLSSPYKVNNVRLYDENNNQLHRYQKTTTMTAGGFNTDFVWDTESGLIIGDAAESFARECTTCNFVRALIAIGKRYGIKSITAQGYNPVEDKGFKFQDVDYSKYDICITNPPFSLYSEFMKKIVSNIDFIVLAPFMNRANPNIGLPLMLRQAYLGHGVELALKFNNPTLENKFSTKMVCCDWITSFSEAQEERNTLAKKTGVNYELYKDEFMEMTGMTMKDGTHPIRVPTGKWPDDYNGWMFGPISIINRISFDEYEWYITQCHKYLNTTIEGEFANSPFNHRVSNDMYTCSDGKRGFGGIVFRKKPKEESKDGVND